MSKWLKLAVLAVMALWLQGCHHHHHHIPGPHIPSPPGAPRPPGLP